MLPALLFLQLASYCLKKFGNLSELCILLPTPKTAQACRAFLLAHSSLPIPTRIVEFVICPDGNPPFSPNGDDEGCLELQIILFPAEHWALAKSFWQHTGMGISSRRADRGLALLGEKKIREVLGEEAVLAVQEELKSSEKQSVDVGRSNSNSPPLLLPTPTHAPRASYSKNRHYSRAGATPSTAVTPSPKASAPSPSKGDAEFASDHAQYVEQRYGRNLPAASASVAKLALRRRIAGVLEGEEISGGRRGVTESDVWLFPTGMTAIWTAHQASLAIRKGDEKKSVCFG